jgi:hypothetical protein
MNERYNQMIGDAYQAYLKKWKPQPVVENELHWMEQELVNDRPLPKDMFIHCIKNDDEFAKKWGVKITERELSFDERTNYGVDILGYESLLDYGHSQNDDDIILELLNIWNVPTKVITLDYKHEIVEYYE